MHMVKVLAIAKKRPCSSVVERTIANRVVACSIHALVSCFASLPSELSFVSFFCASEHGYM